MHARRPTYMYYSLLTSCCPSETSTHQRDLLPSDYSCRFNCSTVYHYVIEWNLVRKDMLMQQNLVYWHVIPTENNLVNVLSCYIDIRYLILVKIIRICGCQLMNSVTIYIYKTREHKVEQYICFIFFRYSWLWWRVIFRPPCK